MLQSINTDKYKVTVLVTSLLLGILSGIKPLYVLFIIFVALMIYMIINKQNNILYILILLLPFPDIHIFSAIWVKNLLIFILFTSLLLSKKDNDQLKKNVFDRFDIVLILLISIILISLFRGLYLLDSVYYENISSSLNFIITNLSLFIICKRVLLKDNQMENIYKLMLISSLIISVLALIQYYINDISNLIPYFYSDQYYGRVIATFDNPNYLGMYIAMCSPLWLSSFLYSKGAFKSFFIFCAYLLMLFATIYTFSRVALFLFLLSSLVCIYLKINSMVVKIITTILALLIGYIIYSHLLPIFMEYRISSTFEGDIWGGLSAQAKSDELRFSGLYSALEVIKQYPLLGIGYGVFTHISGNYNYLGVNINTHNEYLRIFAEIGLFGFIVYLVFLINTVKASLKLIFIDKNKLSIGFFGVILVFIIGSCFINLLENLQLVGFFFTTAACAINLVRIKNINQKLYKLKRDIK